MQEVGGGGGPRIPKGTQWVSQPKGRKKRIPHPNASLPGPSFCRACIRTYKTCFLLHYFFLRTLAIFRGSFHLPILFDPTWKVQNGPVFSLHCLPCFSTSDSSRVLWPGHCHWYSTHRSTRSLAIGRNQVGFMGRRWSKRASPLKAPGNDWCLIRGERAWKWVEIFYPRSSTKR